MPRYKRNLGRREEQAWMLASKLCICMICTREYLICVQPLESTNRSHILLIAKLSQLIHYTNGFANQAVDPSRGNF